MRAVARWSLLIAVVAVLVGTLLALALANTPDERTVALAVVPHPDDEFQMWSLMADTPDEYKIFVSLTGGEETGFCEPEILAGALQEDLGEIAPTPTPTGRWTSSCEQARHESLLGYLTQMSEEDPSIPGDFGEPTVFGPLPADGLEVCRDDDGDVRCDEAVREVRVWEDAEGRGAVVFFDLGDGDLTPEEASWAIRSVIDRRGEWGLDAENRVASILGAFANVESPCFPYPHPDHIAVHEALWNTDFGAGSQIAATCFLNPSQRMSAIVSPGATDAAFAFGPGGVREGAHNRHYGWLHASSYPLSGFRQSSLFSWFQSFWVRFN
jgi:hypothetical protein